MSWFNPIMLFYGIKSPFDSYYNEMLPQSKIGAAINSFRAFDYENLEKHQYQIWNINYDSFDKQNEKLKLSINHTGLKEFLEENSIYDFCLDDDFKSFLTIERLKAIIELTSREESVNFLSFTLSYITLTELFFDLITQYLNQYYDDISLYVSSGQDLSKFNLPDLPQSIGGWLDTIKENGAESTSDFLGEILMELDADYERYLYTLIDMIELVLKQREDLIREYYSELERICNFRLKIQEEFKRLKILSEFNYFISGNKVSVFQTPPRNYNSIFNLNILKWFIKIYIRSLKNDGIDFLEGEINRIEIISDFNDSEKTFNYYNRDLSNYCFLHLLPNLDCSLEIAKPFECNISEIIDFLKKELQKKKEDNYLQTNKVESVELPFEYFTIESGKYKYRGFWNAFAKVIYLYYSESTSESNVSKVIGTLRFNIPENKIPTLKDYVSRKAFSTTTTDEAIEKSLNEFKRIMKQK